MGVDVANFDKALEADIRQSLGKYKTREIKKLQNKSSEVFFIYLSVNRSQ